MRERFLKYAEALHPSFENLVAMEPVTIPALPRGTPAACIYLFSENASHLYVGRTRDLRSRLRHHSIPSANHNQAAFAFRLAREATGRLEADYAGKGRRTELMNDSAFLEAFTAAKERIRRMDLRYVEERDPMRQALLELYASIVLQTPYNDFKTH